MTYKRFDYIEQQFPGLPTAWRRDILQVNHITEDLQTVTIMYKMVCQAFLQLPGREETDQEVESL